MKRLILPPKYQGESLLALFDFTSLLTQGDTLTGTPVVTAATYSGTDPSPSALISGTVTLVGNIARQKIGGGQPGVTYTLLCTASTTNGGVLYLQGFLTVLPSQP